MPVKIKPIFDEAAAEIIAEVTVRMGATGANATGKTVRSLEDNVTDDRMQILGSKSFLFVEVGRKPGKKPPFEPIKEWVKARNLGGTNPDGVAWAVVNAIAKRGTLAKRIDKKQEPRDIYTSVVTKLRIQSILSKINDFKVTQARSEILEAFRGQGVTIV